MTFDEMAQIVDQAREADFYWHQLEQRGWCAEQRAKAGAILELLRQHLPAQVRQEAEELLSTEYGCECVCDLLRHEKLDDAALQTQKMLDDKVGSELGSNLEFPLDDAALPWPETLPWPWELDQKMLDDAALD